MPHPETELVTYGAMPLGEDVQLLRARLYTPTTPGDTRAPVLIWFAGEAVSLEAETSPLLSRIGRVMARWGIATAIVETRQGAQATDLRPATRAALPALIEEAARSNPQLSQTLTGASALAAMEDGAQFLHWLMRHRAALGLSDQITLGGAAGGAVTVLNLLNLAPMLGLTLPPIRNAFVDSGAYAYPSHMAGRATPVLALHGTEDTAIPPGSIRAYAYAAGAACTLIETPDHPHGGLRLTEDEMLRPAVARIAKFAMGELPSEALPVPPVMPRPKRICLVARVGSEAPYLLEWLAHHRQVGVTDFVLFSDPSEDGTREMLDALQARGLVMHVRNPAPALRSGQSRAVAQTLAGFAAPLRSADYVIETTLSDFIDVHVGDGTLSALLAVTGAPDALSLPARRYGFSGVGRFEDVPVSAQFDRAQQAAPVLLSKGAEAVGVDGLPVSPDLAGLRRYPLRSAESFLLRLALGRGSARLPYRLLCAWNVDTYPQPAPACLSGLRAELAALMADPALAALHGRSVLWHRKAIAQLWTDAGTEAAWAVMQPLIGAPRSEAAPGADPQALAAE